MYVSGGLDSDHTLDFFISVVSGTIFLTNVYQGCCFSTAMHITTEKAVLVFGVHTLCIFAEGCIYPTLSVCQLVCYIPTLLHWTVTSWLVFRLNPSQSYYIMLFLVVCWLHAIGYTP